MGQAPSVDLGATITSLVFFALIAAGYAFGKSKAWYEGKLVETGSGRLPGN